ncbi:MAG TPA: NADH-quinone oxidoreductase subunit NuoF [Myxococcales bacterium]|jgi:NADH:ubiquinone oxidoreductase subunit F (NADH-binding)/(2Fe-2S) ferredoxin
MSTASTNPMTVERPRCCDQCWHTPEKPCHDFVACLSEGPKCHSDARCAQSLKDRAARLRRETLARPVVFVGTGTCGLGAGAAKTLAAVRQYLADKKVDADVVEVACIGLCTAEPMVDVQLPGRTRVSFSKITAEKVPGLLDNVLAGKVPFENLVAQMRNAAHTSWEGVPFFEQHPFFAPQTRRVLVNCGTIDPASIDEYIAHGGYRAMADALRAKTPAEVADVVEASGLRGRGGAGFPAGTKWKFAAKESADQKYLVCNADEGDPGAFMNRAEIEGDPHRLLEGMVLAAYAIGATKAYIYIRAEYPLAVRRLFSAIDQAKAYGLLGKNILDSGFSLDIHVKQGAGAFVCGEETALLHSIEGRRGMPRPRPPFPAVKGVFGKPTVINNVETLFNVPSIVSKGAEWFASVGAGKSKGTKVFALSGKVNRTGLVEVAYGTNVRQIVFEIGGGIPNDKKFKAVQIGGPSGACLPTVLLDQPIDYESMKSVGAMIGSGGLVVMDEDTCMIDVAKFFMDFIQRESCGKCIPCREGTRRMLEVLTSITEGRKSEKGIDALHRMHGVMSLQRLAGVIKDTSLCGLGQSAPNPVLSTLKYFRDEYEAHIYERRCPSHVCTELLSYSIDAHTCTGCGVCVKGCPAGAIRGQVKQPHEIDQVKCIGCGACVDTCRFDAILAA